MNTVGFVKVRGINISLNQVDLLNAMNSMKLNKSISSNTLLTRKEQILRDLYFINKDMMLNKLHRNIVYYCFLSYKRMLNFFCQNIKVI